MAYDYLKIRAKVSAKLRQYGVLSTVRRSVGGTRTHATGVITGATDSDYSHYILFQSPQLMDTGKSFVFGADVLRDDRFAIMEVRSDFEVQTGDKVIIGSESWTLINVQKVSPGNVDVMYKLHMRI